MKVWTSLGRAVRLGRSDFVGQGGQGQVWARGDRAYKVATDPASVVPGGKVQELSRIAHPDVLRPLELLLDRRGGVVGHAMRFVPDTEVLCTLIPRSFRESQGLTPDDLLRLVGQLRELVVATHAAGCLVVDLHEMNYLVSSDWRRVYAIDVDSYQTPGFPATAQVDSIRDRHSPPGQFDRGTDWFAFAITAFQLLRGIHPYRGRHPDVADLDGRMIRNLSVLDPAVAVPRVVYPPDVVPEPWRRWFDAVLQRGARIAPPSSLSGPVRLVSARPVGGGDALDLIPLQTLPKPILGWAERLGVRAAWSADTAWVDGRPIPLPHRVDAVGFTPRTNRPVAAWIEDGALCLFDLLDRQPVPIALTASRVVGHRGRLLAHAGDQIVEVGWIEGARRLAAPKVVGQVLPRATALHRGCAVQDLLGRAWFTLFAADGGAHQVAVPELDGSRVVSAAYDGGVLVVVAAKGGRYRRLVVRFDAAHRDSDVRIVDDVAPARAQLVTLDRGVAVCLDEDERLELFARRPGDPRVKRLEDPALSADMHLHDGGGTLVATRGREVVRLGMR